MPEAVTVITGFDDVAVVGKPIQQGCGHLFIDKHVAPLQEAQIGGNNDAGFFIQLADQVEQQGTTGLAERLVTKLIEYNQIGVHEAIGQSPGLALHHRQVLPLIIDRLTGDAFIPAEDAFMDGNGRGPVELKAWFETPTGAVIRALNVLSINLSAGFDIDPGPIPFFTVQPSTPPGPEQGGSGCFAITGVRLQLPKTVSMRNSSLTPVESN